MNRYLWHMKRRSTSLAIREMQVKNLHSYQLFKKSFNTKCWQGCKGTESFTLPGMRNVTATRGNNLAVSYKTKHALAIYPVFALLSIYPREMKTCVHKKTCMWLLKAVLFVIVKIWLVVKTNILQQVVKTNCSISIPCNTTLQ